MLSLLHAKINSIVPIIGIQKNNNEFLIEYENPDNVTPEQLSMVNSIIESWPTEIVRLSKIQELESWWQSQLSNGYQTSLQWKLGLKNEDVTLLTGAFLLAKEAAQLGLSQEATIMDTEGVSHTMSIPELTSLMLRYGQYRSSLSVTYNDKKRAIENCTSIEQINEIII